MTNCTRVVLCCVLLVLISPLAQAQEYLGLAGSNYSGLWGIDVNPASIVDSRYRTDVAISFNGGFSNDYAGLKRTAFSNIGDAFAFRKEAEDGTKLYNNYWNENWRDNNNKSVYSQAQVNLGVMLSTSAKSAFAFTTRARILMSGNDINSYFVKGFLNGFDLSGEAADSIYNKEINLDNASVQAISLFEYGLSYGRVVYDRGKHFAKVAGRVKYLQGIASTSAYATNLKATILNKDELRVAAGSNFTLSYSKDFAFEDIVSQIEQESQPSIGLDLGVVYEFRPDYQKYRYNQDGERGLIARGETQYKLRVGISVTDLGSLKFKNDSFTGTFDPSDERILTAFSSASFNEFRDNLINQVIDYDSISSYTVRLPTALGLQIDWHAYGKLFVNVAIRKNMVFDKNYSVRQSDYYMVAPRFESRIFDLTIPFYYDNLGKSSIGTAVRLGPLVIGSNSLVSTLLLSDGDIYSADAFLGFRIGVRYNKSNDRDGDGVSNSKDKDNENPGPWEFRGAPDKDGDHVPDSLDKCPDDPGLPETNGCPDRDFDGVLDVLDKCPDEAGSPTNEGCPL